MQDLSRIPYRDWPADAKLAKWRAFVPKNSEEAAWKRKAIRQFTKLVREM